MIEMYVFFCIVALSFLAGYIYNRYCDHKEYLADLDIPDNSCHCVYEVLERIEGTDDVVYVQKCTKCGHITESKIDKPYHD